MTMLTFCNISKRQRQPQPNSHRMYRIQHPIKRHQPNHKTTHNNQRQEGIHRILNNTILPHSNSSLNSNNPTIIQSNSNSNLAIIQIISNRFQMNTTIQIQPPLRQQQLHLRPQQLVLFLTTEMNHIVLLL